MQGEEEEEKKKKKEGARGGHLQILNTTWLNSARNTSQQRVCVAGKKLNTYVQRSQC